MLRGIKKRCKGGNALTDKPSGVEFQIIMNNRTTQVITSAPLATFANEELAGRPAEEACHRSRLRWVVRGNPPDGTML